MDDRSWFDANETEVARWWWDRATGYVRRRTSEWADENQDAALQFIRKAYEYEVGPGRMPEPQPPAFEAGNVAAARAAYRENPNRKTAEAYARARLREAIPDSFFEGR